MLRADNVHKIYKDGKRELHVLKGVSLELRKDEVIAVVGPSGAGKSTLLHILGGIDKPSSGKVFLDNSDFYSLDDVKRAGFRNQKIGFVFQFYHLLPDFTALENVMLPGMIRGEGCWTKAGALKNRSEILLENMGLGKRMRHRPSELSGGEQQRVAIARALINNPKVLLCDEPTGNLDSEMGLEILNILFNLNKKNKTAIVIVTHDKEIAKRAHKIIEMKDGRMSWD
ncbi:MAG: lipoprotein-releasing system ATP-binding protein LolD [Candidatus Omnitrophica bacterium CG02_land_8_20_14_3_00__42_8]|nr:MAG: lipoprotein-releasing system ATP-binding protein LolD [Candidatus Omnitrophica bacterium CG02_land_8_20_14_3_00__42_8]PIW68555.1 MAG: lipoprotein-releasing system ATP-binding protein LolD [Candidatus Omnitrophica bacterium CG12_big_fil_rev_8_21_14_0_65_42_8]